VCEISHATPLRFTSIDFLTLLHSLPKPDPAYWDAGEDRTKQTPAVPESPWGPDRFERSDRLGARPSRSTIPIGGICRRGLCDIGDDRIGVAPWGSSRANPAQRRRREASVEGLLARLPVVSFAAVAARIHARLSAALAANGTAVGPHDLIIAATALTKGYIVTTRDERSFPRIPGSSYRRW